ncbi:hypothetical protein LJ114_04530 [Propionibacterium freudenreichii]|nr:hypothetical protein LJ114_04530 [Propionibacterium freudenreichii]
MPGGGAPRPAVHLGAPRRHHELAAGLRATGPLVAEIGSGVGDSLVAMAGARPSDNVIAFEVYLTAVASTMGKLARADVHNVRLVVADGGEGLRELVRPGELSELWTFFPDPWPKKRHHKRRLVQPGFAALVADRLAPGGCGDWPPTGPTTPTRCVRCSTPSPD